MSEGGGFGGRTGMYFIDLCKGNPKLTENARCIKARYDSGIGNRSADNSGVLCMGADCPDRTDETALIQLKRSEPKIREQDYTKCLIAGYNKIGVSNRGESSGVFYGCRAVLTPDRENKRQNGRRFKECGEPAFCLNTQDKHGAENRTGYGESSTKSGTGCLRHGKSGCNRCKSHGQSNHCSGQGDYRRNKGADCRHCRQGLGCGCCDYRYLSDRSDCRLVLRYLLFK